MNRFRETIALALLGSVLTHLLTGTDLGAWLGTIAGAVCYWRASRQTTFNSGGL